MTNRPPKRAIRRQRSKAAGPIDKPALKVPDIPALPSPPFVMALWYTAGIITLWAFGYTVMRGSDLWWHLAAGDRMAQIGAFLYTDPWSFTFEGKPWLNDAWLSDLIYPIEKGDLAALRLLHFLALAFVCWHVIPSNHAILQSRLLRPLVQCGEHSLVIFCASVLLSFAAHFVLVQISNDLAAQCLVVVGGILIMSALAALLSRLDRRGTTHPRTI